MPRWRQPRIPKLPPAPISLPGGGCTFAEDPAQNCALVLPCWSAVVDPRVLAVRALPSAAETRAFDARAESTRFVRGPDGEHLVIDRGGEPMRLDVSEGTMLAGPVCLRFDVADDSRLAVKLEAIMAFRAPAGTGRAFASLAQKLQALHAVDARNAGASLKETAEFLFGQGDWPGDGEHRKSCVRRLVETGMRLIHAGPRGVLEKKRRVQSAPRA